MKNLTKEKQLELVSSVLDKLNKNEFNLYFMIIDTKGNPSSSLEYMYQLAYKLKGMGYNSQMVVVPLNDDEEYVGPFNWLDEKYKEIPVTNISKNVGFGPEDFIFVPEILSDVLLDMKKKVKSKKILVVNDYKRMADFFPALTEFPELGVKDCITTTNSQKKKIESIFRALTVHVVSPSIENKFRPMEGPKGIGVNLIIKNPSERNRITKEFYWKYPVYRWVTFRDLRGVDQDTFSEALRELDITVWSDESTEFGTTLLQSLKSGGLTLAKVPSNISDWMHEKEDDGQLSKSCLWFSSIDEVPSMLASIIRSWTLDVMPSELMERCELVKDLYTNEYQIDEIKESIVSGIIEKRKSEFKELTTIIEKNEE